MDDFYAATEITDYLGSANKVTGKEVANVDNMLYKVADDIAEVPMLAISAAMAKAGKATPTHNYKTDWFKKRLYRQKDTIVTGASTGTTIQVVVSDADIFQLDDVVDFPESTVSGATQTRTGVITTKSTVTLTITPIDHSGSITNMCAVVAGETICLVGNASGDNSTAPGMKMVQDEADYNYIQFTRVPYGVGIIAEGTKNYTGSEKSERKEEQFQFSRLQWENIIMFGRRGYRTNSTGGNATVNDRQYFCQGLQPYLLTNDGDNLLANFLSVTESQFDEWWMAGPGLGGSLRRNFFLSSEAFTHINSWAKTKERIVQANVTAPQANKLGLAITKYQAVNGKILNLVPHTRLGERYPGAGLLVDPKFAKLQPFTKYGTFFHKDNTQANDHAGTRGEWWMIGTMKFPILEWHGWVYN